MVTMFVRHRVSDFSAWKVAYDEFDAERTSLGVRGDGVFQSDEDPNDVTVFHEFDSIESAREFADSERLKTAMQNAGVVGAPDIWFTNRA